MAKNENWEPDVRKAMDHWRRTGGRLQDEAEEIAQRIRETAVSPIEILGHMPIGGPIDNRGPIGPVDPRS